MSPVGEWLLFLDDDVTGWRQLKHTGETSSNPQEFPEFVIQAFLGAQRQGMSLWGFNPSQDPRCLRLGLSHNLGLICGYGWGVISGSLIPRLPVSDNVGGAAEDIERSLRSFVAAGRLLRFPSAQILAATWSNEGGLQSSLGKARTAAHDYAIMRLSLEFPQLLMPDSKRPLRCRFLQRSSGAHPASSGYDSTNLEEASGNEDVSADMYENECENECENERKLQLEIESQDESQNEGKNSLKEKRKHKHKDEDKCKYKRKDRSENEPDEPKNDQRQRRRTTRAKDNAEAVIELPRPSRRRRTENTERLTRQTADGRFACPQCQRLFIYNKDLNRHMRTERCFSRRGRYQAAYVV
jgi:hypothetical protein